MKVSFAVLTLGLFTGCSAAGSLEQLMGVQVDDNASLCVEIETQIPAPMFMQSVRIKRVELPADVDTSNWTADDVQAAESAICDN